MKRWIIGLAVVVVLVGVGGINGGLSHALGSVFPDPGLFGEPVPIPGIPEAASISVNPAGDLMVFQNDPVHHIYTAQWSGSEWTNKQKQDLGGGSWQSHPCLSPDGEWIFYATSNGSPAQSKLYRSKSQSGGTWAPGEPLPEPDGQSAFDAYVSCPMFNGEKLYFRLYVSGDRADLYESVYDKDSDTFGPPEPLPPPINDGGNNQEPFVICGKTLLFSSNRSGMTEIWMATRNDSTEDWSVPFRPPWPIDAPGTAELWPRYSSARSTLYFSRYGAAYESHVIPEPSTFIICSMGALGLLVYAWRRRRRGTASTR